MRLPPPARRYSPISVMASTFETVSRPNSCSMAAKSSRSNSKTSLPLMMAGELNFTVYPLLVRPVICELHINSEILLLQQGNDFLQSVAIFPAHPDQISLNRRLDFLLRVLDKLHNFAGFLNGNSLLHGDALFGHASRRRLDRSVGEAFQRHSAFHQLLLKYVVHCLQLVFVNRVQDDRVFAFQFDIRFRIFQIEPSMDFLQRLLDSVADLLQIDFAYDIESVFWHLKMVSLIAFSHSGYGLVIELYGFAPCFSR